MIGWVALLSGLLAVEARAGPAGPEISRSRGPRGGVVVLWPRIVPEEAPPDLRAMAGRLQARLYAAAATVLGTRRVEIRPEPERTCPERGCRAVAASLVLGHRDSGCVLLLALGEPDGGPVRLRQIAGAVDIDRPVLQFREPPERGFVITEFASCASLEAVFEDEAVARAVAEQTER